MNGVTKIYIPACRPQPGVIVGGYNSWKNHKKLKKTNTNLTQISGKFQKKIENLKIKTIKKRLIKKLDKNNEK